MSKLKLTGISNYLINLYILRVYKLLRHFLSAPESSARPRPLVSARTGLLGLSLAQTSDQRLEDTRTRGHADGLIAGAQ